jgi:hypothetical protein
MSRPAEMGIAQRTAYALAIWPDTIATRAAIRDLLPTGRIRDIGVTGHLNALSRSGSPGRKNTVSRKYSDALYRFDREGWVDRGRVLLRVKDRDALRCYALNGYQDGSLQLPAAAAALDTAVAQAATRREETPR